MHLHLLSVSHIPRHIFMETHNSPQKDTSSPSETINVTEEREKKEKEKSEAAAHIAEKVQQELQRRAELKRKEELRQKEEYKRKEEQQRKAEQQARETAARKAEQFGRESRLEKQRLREEAERAELLARKKREDAVSEEVEAVRLHFQAEAILAAADRERDMAEEAAALAKTAWLAAMDRQAFAGRHVEEARSKRDDALHQRQMAGTNRKLAEQEEVGSRAEREKAEQEETKASMNDSEHRKRREEEEEAKRQAQLVESIRKMQELQRLEEADRVAKERARQEKIAEAIRRKAEAERLERERMERERMERERMEHERIQREKVEREKAEAERKVREQKEREEQEQRDAERRQREYVHAAAKERGRCQNRDKAFSLNLWFNWEHGMALQRFALVSAEFDNLKFCDAQPLTFESVPWPTLTAPNRLRLEDIDWNSVESFFSMAEKTVKDKVEYKSLVEKAHRRFHPDKWKARRLLKTVLDDTLRGKLEEKGNAVAQALTPLWMKSKGITP